MIGKVHYNWLRVNGDLILQRVDEGTNFILESHDFGYAVIGKFQAKFYKDAQQYAPILTPRIIGYDDVNEMWFDNMSDEEDNDKLTPLS